MSYTINLCNVVCQLYFNKTGKNRIKKNSPMWPTLCPITPESFQVHFLTQAHVWPQPSESGDRPWHITTVWSPDTISVSPVVRITSFIVKEPKLGPCVMFPSRVSSVTLVWNSSCTFPWTSWPKYFWRFQETGLVQWPSLDVVSWSGQVLSLF